MSADMHSRMLNITVERLFGTLGAVAVNVQYFDAR